MEVERSAEKLKAEQAHIEKEQAEQRETEEQKKREMSLWDRVVLFFRDMFKEKKLISVKDEGDIVC